MRVKCVYCSKLLSWVCDTEYSIDEKKPPRICGVRRYTFADGTRDYFNCRSTKFLRTDEGWKCADDDCRTIHKGRKNITKREHRYNKPGPNGDGLFCSKTHGWKFGILAARAGYKLKRLGNK